MEKVERVGAGSPAYRDCLLRLRQWEPVIDAWAHVAEPPAEAGPEPAANAPLPLDGVPFAVKDVIDVAGQPTRFGSRVFEAAAPATDDAPVVAALRRAGAIPVGKTRTTEFAFTDPTITRNPYDPRHSPGGSSSGSGAAVGARVVPFALGTQTAGSLCRPAAYCGAVSYKPGLGRLPLAGVAPLSRSFDAVGVIAQSMPWLSRVFDVLEAAFGDDAMTGDTGERPLDKPLRVGVVRVPGQTPAADMSRAMDTTVDRFRGAGHAVDAVSPAIGFADLIAWHRSVMLHEAAGALLPAVDHAMHLVGPRLADGLREGRQIPSGLLADARERIAASRDVFWRQMARYDVLLAYAVSAAAPAGLATTGDQSYLTPWTALGGPLVSLFAGLDEAGMPLGVLLAAAPGRDAALMRMAARLDPLMPSAPAPVLPAAGSSEPIRRG